MTWGWMKRWRMTSRFSPGARCGTLPAVELRVVADPGTNLSALLLPRSKAGVARCAEGKRCCENAVPQSGATCRGASRRIAHLAEGAFRRWLLELLTTRLR